MAGFIPLGLIILFVSVWLHQRFSVRYCDTEIGRSDANNDFCGTLTQVNGLECRRCPLNGKCESGSIKSCDEGFKLLKGQMCHASKGNAIEENLLNRLVEMDDSFLKGKNFKDWGFENAHHISG